MVKSKKRCYPPDSTAFEGSSLHTIPEIKTNPGDIYITKQTCGAFYKTALDKELKKRNITSIVLGDISTSIGVEGRAGK
ncbi:MAG TPA: isochorismatase family protein [Hanamia sp.]|nr:isochorismatase family protein [Hanamia sp.]